MPTRATDYLVEGFTFVEHFAGDANPPKRGDTSEVVSSMHRSGRQRAREEAPRLARTLLVQFL
jgi:hypothetical protein